ncbi:ABC-type amino acid transport/signal transduction systems, periplasmic component/domain [Hahella chejuensis KCTC 2396]|uniref:ABC-type amino acid transport/signal transduction systems, periplasmic component/domain n=1 Tax=Hahella chejuensis (strain KCTC 2396) TaxID=349521 RepID=Q2SAC9_HAHCH|nr:transporter substrate-binding domain-containing protein [Hahella chejuensis]ABC32395.1 ABC-type amino acid transport/signal transduction systems, periplasmic component/domain [Hahella chejuensis KCTC 2396]
MVTIRSGALCSALLWLQTLLCAADSELKLHAVSEEWAAYSNADCTGLYWDVLNAIYMPDGVTVICEIVPWKRALYWVSNKEKDALVGVYGSRKDVMRIPELHFCVDDPVVALFLRGPHQEWRGVRRVRSGEAAWIRGYDFKQWFNSGMEPVELESIEQGLELVTRRRVKYIIDYSVNIQRAMRELELEEQDYKYVTVKSGEKLYVGFADNERGRLFEAILDRNLPQLYQSGELERIYKKWGMKPQWRHLRESWPQSSKALD